MFLWSAQQYQEADLVLPDGGRVHYVRISPGTGFTDAEFEHTTTPTLFHRSRIKWNGNGWDLTLKDGTVYVFGDLAPLQSIRDRNGNTVRLTWSSTNAAGSGTGNILRVTAPHGRWIAFTYDASNRVTQAKDNIGRTVTYTYDANGRLWKVTDPANGITEYTYDASHRMLTVKDPRGITFLTNEYDANGRVSRQIQADATTYQFTYTLDGNGRIVQADVTNPRNYIDRYTFNSSRQLITRVRAVGTQEQQTTTYEREAGTNVVLAVTDALARRTEYTYDAKGNQTTVRRLAGTADQVTTTFAYEQTFSQIASMTDPLNHTTSFAYDAKGNLFTATDPLNKQTTFTYNTAGQVLTVTNPLNQTTQFAYDLGDLVSVTNPLGFSDRRFLDAAGRLLRLTNPAGHAINYEYNALNLLAAVIDPLGGRVSFAYDGNGNLLTLTDVRAKTTTSTYDAMDRVATRTDALNRQEGFTYDSKGNLTQWTDRRGLVTAYQYDGLDRQTFAGFGATGVPPNYVRTITTTYDAGNRNTGIVDSTAGTISRTYDLLDRLTQEMTPEGVVSYAYDAASRRTTMTVTGQPPVAYTYDVADRLTTVTQSTASIMVSHDDAGRRTALTLPNGVLVEYNYDGASRLTAITYKHDTSTLGDVSYQYDAAGQRMSTGGTFARTGLPQALTSATYDDANQIATWGGTPFTYDANGNLTSDGIRTYVWNARNELESMSGPVSANFTYDGLGRRRGKTVGSTTTQLMYDGLNAVQELSAGSVVANILTGLWIDEHFTRTDANGTVTYLADVLGSSVALANDSGTLQTEYTYESFGAATTTGAQTASTFGFTGREADGTGLAFFRARYYDSRLQRFISEDPIGFMGGLNLYSYVSNAPTGYLDPLGLKPSPRFGGGPGGGPGPRTRSGSPGAGGPAPGDPAGRGSSSAGGAPPGAGGSGNDSDCDKPSCLDVFADCLRDWVLPGWSTAAEELARAGAAGGSIRAYNAALAHAARRGLTYPQKSSIVRSLFAQSQSLAKLAGGPILALININIGIVRCLWLEVSEGVAGNCTP